MTSASRPARRLLADGSLVLVTVIWGTTFVVVKVAVEVVDPVLFVGARFALGALVLAPLYLPRALRAGMAVWKGGALLGLALFAGFGFQTFGLRETTPSRAAFITGLSVVIVPVLSALLLRTRPSRSAQAGVLLSAVGMLLLSAPFSAEEIAAGSWLGDALVFACAVAFALHIVGVGYYAGRQDPGTIAFLQVAVVAVLALLVADLPRAPLPPSAAWPAIVYMGTAATALVFLIQNWAQIHTSPTHTALIFALEPVFAALFSMLFYGEVIPLRAVFGGALIVAGMLVAELRR